MFIKVWLMPERNEEQMKALWDKIVACVRSMKGLKDLPGREMPVAFPKDAMAYGLGTEIVVEVMNIPPKMVEGHATLLLALRDLIKEVFPEAKSIYCYEVPVKKVVSLVLS